MPSSVQITKSLRNWMDVFMSRSLRGWTHFAKSTGLSMPQFSIMMQLHYKGKTGLSHISERFDITAAAASQLVDKLVQSGHIDRAEDPNDRRAKLLCLSGKGAKLLQDGIEERYRWMDDLVKHMSPADQARVVEALDILTTAARQMDEAS